MRKLWRINKYVFLLILILPVKIVAQRKLKGRVLIAGDNTPLFGANVYLKHHPSGGTATNMNGSFVLKISKNELADSLIISSVGYHKKIIALSSVQWNGIDIFHIHKDVSSLNKITVTSNPSLTEEFSTEKLNRISIYMSPVSEGDPLKVISSLPASTNTSETANPALRGSSGKYSRVILNGVPLYNPVRDLQLNGLGNFSILNTEIVDNETVYAGNPPLKYGNSIAGLVDVRTRKRLKNQQLKIDGGLVGAGMLFETPIKDNTTFMQVFGNYHLSDAYLSVNKQNSPHLKKFRSQDIGLNFHYTISNHLSANTYSYFINDNYNAKNLFYNYAGNIHFNKKRYFNVFNVKYIMNNIVVEFNNEFNVSNLHYRFGIIREDTKVNQFYNVVDMKYLPNGHISFTLGITDGLFIDKFTNTLPQNYYSIHPEDPSYGFRHREKNLNIETYGYVRYTAPKVAIGAGFRKNLSIKNQESYLSYQGNLRYTFISQSSVHISAGKYNGYTVPSFYIQQFNHVSAVQYAIGYRYKSNNSTFGISVYKKREIFPKYFKDVGRGQQTTKDIKGLEISTQYQMRHFLFSASYTWLDSKFKKGVQWIKSSNSMNYLVKLSLSHTSIKHLNFSINYITRPGHFYTPIINGEKISKTRGFKPVFGTYNAQQLNSYSRIDLTANKVISYNNLSIIPFFTLTNILNNENQRTPVYSRDYGKISNYWYYEKRLIYFGVQVSF